MIVAYVAAPKSPKMKFIERNDMVEQFATRAPHPTFRRSVLPGAPNARADGLEITGSQKLQNVISELGIMVEHNVTIRTRERECFPELLHNPIACWMEGNVEVQNAPPTMFDDEEAG